MKVLTVGGAMIDTIAIIDSSLIELMKMRNADTSFLLLEEGRKTEALEISTHCGGGAVNTAVAMARLGCEAAAIVKLGRDSRAQTILSGLSAEGVSTRWVIRDATAPTGASVLVSSHDRNAAIFTFRGANGFLDSADLDDAAFAVDLVHVCSLSNRSSERFPEIVARANRCGARVSTNPGIRQLSARAGELLDVLARIDILSLNRAEAAVLVPSLAGVRERGASDPVLSGGDLPALVRRGLISGGHEMGLAAYLRTLCRLGPSHVLLTDGAAGAFVGTRDEILFCPALKAKVMGTAGAGDAFASTFATEIGRGREAADALRAATVNAASVLGHVDTQTGLLSRQELDNRLGEVGSALEVRRWPV